ncbi:cyclomaltodextrin glucanotransferase [Alteromonas pelagimontana]|uniref:Cyclomaltodextrin glucanotransferase n=1 Tax=Alteromonas pelagimontana TaxID=1858656 RepID=A0A6M4MH53_9ALTE|nr:alpha-amylase family glycosyl hydrolase [Alteromonas pelagimontana]QJR82541.1 cyclomaltodextrin glucanotransferase [Alteromonas pelagimontana]
MNLPKYALLPAIIASVISGCAGTDRTSVTTASQAFYGTKEPFTAQAIYFVMTDRFVDGDSQNNYPDQGGEHPTWQLELQGPDGKSANVGYMGGDLKGVLNNADYIKNMGFTAVWLTPVVDNPDQAFTGGEPIEYGGQFKDGGKTGYHGYWATNFYQADEHLVSEDLSFKDYTTSMRQNHGLKTVFDIVANHGSPSFTMPVDQPGFGELYDAQGKLVADHKNLPPEELDTSKPLQSFFHDFPDLAQLSNLNEDNPDVQDYLINSYLYWIDQGADAFRIDTIRHVKHSFWREMSDRIRSAHPGFYMFGESFQYDANFIAQHTLPKNGGISVLDFPMQKAMVEVFTNKDSDFGELEDVLYLTHGPYNNPYELTTFYDNHDMPRMDASDAGFMNAHNWLFTVRGIPVVYQGSEIGFMRGTAEHEGNRNYFGQSNIEKAKNHPIHNALKKIAMVRKATPALQRGLQLNIKLQGNTASFYRILQEGDISQTALVLLNKGNAPASFSVNDFIQAGEWTEQLSGESKSLTRGATLNTSVAANSVQVWVRDGIITEPTLIQTLENRMAAQ